MIPSDIDSRIIEQLEKEVTKLQEYNQQLQEENQDLLEQNQKYAEVQIRCNNDIKQLQKENQDLKKVLKETENSLRCANLHIMELEKRLSEKITKLSKLEQYCENLEEEKTDLEFELETKIKENDPTDLD